MPENDAVLLYKARLLLEELLGSKLPPSEKCEILKCSLEYCDKFIIQYGGCTDEYENLMADILDNLAKNLKKLDKNLSTKIIDELEQIESISYCLDLYVEI